MRLYETVKNWIAVRIPTSWVRENPYYKSGVNEAYTRAESQFHHHLNSRMELARQTLDAVKNEKTTLEQMLTSTEVARDELEDRNKGLEDGLRKLKVEYEALKEENLKYQDDLRELLPTARAETARVYQKLKLLCKQLPWIKDKPMLFVGPNGRIEDFNDAAKNKIRDYQLLLGVDYEKFIESNPVKSLRLVNKQGRWIEIGKVFYDPVGIEFKNDKSGVVILEKVTSVYKYFRGITRRYVKEVDEMIRRKSGKPEAESS